MAELFVIEASQRRNKGRGRPKGTTVWLPFPDVYTKRGRRDQGNAQARRVRQESCCLPTCRYG